MQITSFKHPLIGCLALLSFSTVAEQFTANLGVTSNYVWRGVTQSDDGISVSAGLDYSNKGFYLGTWLGTVDYNDDTKAEYDLFGGYQLAIDNINLDLGYIYYGFVGENDINSSEFYVKGSYEQLAMGVSILADSQAGDDFADNIYYEISHPFAITDSLSLNLHAGYYDFAHGDNYSDFKVSLEKHGFELAVSHLNGNKDLEDTLVFLSYSHTFNVN